MKQKVTNALHSPAAVEVGAYNKVYQKYALLRSLSVKKPAESVERNAAKIMCSLHKFRRNFKSGDN